MRWIHGTSADWIAGNGGSERTAGVSARELAARAVLSCVGEGDRDLDRERDLDRCERVCVSEKERMWDLDEMLSRSSRRTGSSPIDCAAASRRRSRSSSSGGRGGGAEISITSENRNWVGGGGGRIFLLLLRCRENGSAIAEERSKLPRARLGAFTRGFGG